MTAAVLWTIALAGFAAWDDEPGKLRPHGRRCWLIWFQGVRYPFGGGACIDLSIMPRMSKAELATAHAEQPAAADGEK